MSTDVQTANGYLKIANELYDALCRLHLSGYENQVLRAVIRLTYGYNQKSAKIPLDKIKELTEIKQTSRISEAIKNLVSMNILHKSGKRFSVNKHYQNWKLQKTVNKNVTEIRKKSYGKPEIQLRKSVTFTDGLKDNIKDKRHKESKIEGFQPISFFANQFLEKIENESL